MSVSLWPGAHRVLLSLPWVSAVSRIVAPGGPGFCGSSNLQCLSAWLFRLPLSRYLPPGFPAPLLAPRIGKHTVSKQRLKNCVYNSAQKVLAASVALCCLFTLSTFLLPLPPEEGFAPLLHHNQKWKLTHVFEICIYSSGSFFLTDE